jgi:hypothetical protein
MQVHLDGLSDQDIRTQPWKDSIHDARGKHYNFREHPELIRQVLEDFKPHEEYESIQKFYELLEWINGPDSNFESSDCRLTGPGPNMQKEKFHWDIHAGGRLMVFFRNLPYNVTPVTEDWVITDRVQGKARLYEPSSHGWDRRVSRFLNRYALTYGGRSYNFTISPLFSSNFPVPNGRNSVISWFMSFTAGVTLRNKSSTLTCSQSLTPSLKHSKFSLLI